MKSAIIGIQGQRGSYHEIVAHKHFGTEANIRYYTSFKEVFDALKNEDITEAVVAIANNRFGFVPGAFSQLMSRTGELTITGEHYLAVKHQLIGLPEASLQDITAIHSMSVAIGQCEAFLNAKLPEALIIEEPDTAYSVQLVAEKGDRSKAAIGSEAAAKFYGLAVLAKNIQDDENNITRFYTLTKKTNNETSLDGVNKTTALLKTSQEAGALVSALQPFKDAEVNISTLHSSFLPNTGFDMQFLIEFDAAMNSPEMKVVLSSLRSQNAELRSLGSYKKSHPGLI
jgi:prephenate dehydratase